jgi:hypothetical protein
MEHDPNVSDWSVQGLGTFVDDIVVSTGEGSTSFETGMDGWTASGAPPGSARNANDFVRHDGRRIPRGRGGHDRGHAAELLRRLGDPLGVRIGEHQDGGSDLELRVTDLAVRPAMRLRSFAPKRALVEADRRRHVVDGEIWS